VQSSLVKEKKEDPVSTKTWNGVEEKVDKMIAAVEKQKYDRQDIQDGKLLEIQEAIKKKLDEDKHI